MCRDTGKQTRSGIRVRYSTIINYISYIYRLGISVGYSMIVIRTLPVNDYGIFSTLFALYAMFIPFLSIWTMWGYRFYARKGPNPITSASLMASILYSVIIVPIIILLIHSIPYFKEYTYLLIIIAVPSTISQIIYNTLRNIISAKYPYIQGYGSVVADTARLASAYILLRIYEFGLTGALLSLLITYFAQLIYILIFIKYHGITLYSVFPDKKSFQYIFKNSYIPVLRMIRFQLQGSGEKLLTGLITSSPLLPAYLGVAYVSRRIVAGSSFAFTRGLSAGLLHSPSKRDIEDVLRITFVVGIFSMGGLIIYSKVFITFLNPLYINAYILLSLYSIASFIDILTSIFYNIGISLDRSDLLYEGISLRRSILFKYTLLIAEASILRFIFASILFIVFTAIGINDPILLLLPFPLLSILFGGTLSYILYKRDIELIEFNIPQRELFSSLFAILSVFFLARINGWTDFMVQRISRDYPMLLLIFLSSLLVYIGIIVLLSKWTRKMLILALKHLMPLKSRGGSGRDVLS